MFTSDPATFEQNLNSLPPLRLIWLWHLGYEVAFSCLIWGPPQIEWGLLIIGKYSFCPHVALGLFSAEERGELTAATTLISREGVEKW